MFWVIVMGGVVVIAGSYFSVFVIIWASRYTKVGPNQVLIISGRKHKMVDPDGNDARISASASSKAAACSCGRSWKKWTSSRSNC